LPLAREMYLEQPSDMRIKYKLIKDAFRDPKSINSIFIVPRGKSKEEDPGIIKKIIKKAISLIRSNKEFSPAEITFLNEIFESMYEEEEELING
jgi:hypothetical protein